MVDEGQGATIGGEACREDILPGGRVPGEVGLASQLPGLPGRLCPLAEEEAGLLPPGRGVPQPDRSFGAARRQGSAVGRIGQGSHTRDLLAG